MNHYDLAQKYLVQIGVYIKRLDIPVREKFEFYNILHHKYLHHKQMVRSPELQENLSGLEELLWNIQ